MREEDLVGWMSLALKKALTRSNIMIGFKRVGIWLLNFEATKQKMNPSK